MHDLTRVDIVGDANTERRRARLLRQKRNEERGKDREREVGGKIKNKTARIALIWLGM